jgi:glycosyltransferase involved in cell wall biosynthesis
MRPVNDPPAVSAVLLSYDCEAHIGAALDSVMAQDYDGPLEIVVSDDHSRDRSYEVVRAQLEGYRGPRRIVLKRRAANSGSKSAHLNDVLPGCTGELLISFDGDDVSEPTRVSRIAARFQANPEAQAVYSSFTLTDGAMRKSRLARVPRPPPAMEAAAWFARVDAYAAGATLAVRRDVIDAFGPLDPSLNEDVQLPFRASFTADWERYDSVEKYRERMFTGLDMAARARRSRLADIDAMAARQPDRHERWVQLRGLVDRSMQDAELTRALVSDHFPERLRGLIALLRAGAYGNEFPQHACLALAPWLYLWYRRRRLGTAARKFRTQAPDAGA